MGVYVAHPFGGAVLLPPRGGSIGIYILEGALLGDSDRLNTPTSFSTRGPCLDSSRTATAVKGEWAVEMHAAGAVRNHFSDNTEVLTIACYAKYTCIPNCPSDSDRSVVRAHMYAHETSRI